VVVEPVVVEPVVSELVVPEPVVPELVVPEPVVPNWNDGYPHPAATAASAKSTGIHFIRAEHTWDARRFVTPPARWP
jgi:hypothetical protein